MAIFYEFLNLRSPSQALWNLFLCFIISSLVFVCYNIVQGIRRRAKYNALIPGLKMTYYDIIGYVRYVYLSEKARKGRSLQSIVLQALAGTAKLYEDHKLMCCFLGYHPILIPLKGEAAEIMLKDSAILEKNFMYKMMRQYFGEGLVTSSGEKWKCRRKMLNPCFHWEILKEFIPIFNEQSFKLVRNLQKGSDDEIRELYKPVFHCILDIVCETLMGVKIGAQDNKNTQYIDSIEKMKKVVVERIVTWWMWPDFIFRYTKSCRIMNESLRVANEFTDEILQQKKKQYLCRGPEQTATKRKSFLESLLEHHIDIQSLSDEDIKEELNTFSAAANDTTSVAIHFALYFLGLYKDIQDNAQREVDQIFGDDKDRPAEKGDLSRMNYIECVIKETMRIHPSVPLIARTVTTDITICDYSIQKGTSCAISPYILHRDPEAFPDPEKFDPTRFFPENSAKRHPYSYIPFSGGPRNCIGQKFAMMVMKTILSTILRHFTIESLDQRDTLDLSLDVTLNPSNPLKFRLKRRI